MVYYLQQRVKLCLHADRVESTHKGRHVFIPKKIENHVVTYLYVCDLVFENNSIPNLLPHIYFNHNFFELAMSINKIVSDDNLLIFIFKDVHAQGPEKVNV